MATESVTRAPREAPDSSSRVVIGWHPVLLLNRAITILSSVAGSIDRLHTAELESRSVGHELVTNAAARPVIEHQPMALASP